MQRIRLMWWDMMVTTFRMRFQYTILNPLQDAFTNRHRYIKHLKPMRLWFARSYPVYMIIVLSQYRRHITAATSILMRYCIMSMVILGAETISKQDIFHYIRQVFPTDRALEQWNEA